MMEMYVLTKTIVFKNVKSFTYIILLISISIAAQTTTKKTSVYFETDQSILSLESKASIDQALALDSVTSITNIFLTGYCDDRGSISYNKTLASRRIWSIIDYLKPQYNYSTFSEVAIGEVPLVNLKNINQQRKNNRRVDLEITYERKLPIPEISAVSTDTLTGAASYDIFKDSLKIGDKLVFNNVIFYPGRHKLRPSSFPVMDSIINSLLLHKKYEIEIQGHICCLAPGIYGRDMDTGLWNLSQARADQVKQLMVKYGVAADRLTTVGKQSNFKTGKGDYYDRRVEIHITGIREEVVEKKKRN